MPKTLDELREMQRVMWKHHPPTRNSYGHSVEVGTLTASEVQAVMEAIEEHQLVCELTGVGFGFGRIGLALYRDEPFPGVGPEFLFCLSQNHLDKNDFPWTGEATYGNVQDKAWDLFAAARSEHNIARLRALGLEVVERGSLCY